MHAVILAVAVATAGCQDSAATAREYLKKGDAFIAQGKHREAIVEYQNAVKLDSTFAEPHERLSEAYKAIDDLRRALRETISTADLRLRDVRSQLRAGDALLFAHRFEDAQARARNALKLEPTNVAALVLLGNALAGLQNFDEAIAANQRAITLDSKRALSFTNLGALYLVNGDRKAAIDAFMRAIELDPRSAAPQIALGNYYAAVGDTSSAEQAFKKAVDIEPKDVSANQALAYTYVTSGKIAAAEPYFVAAAMLSKETASKITLADYYLATFRSSDALRILEPLTARPADFARVKTRMALVHYSEGNPGAAFNQVTEALARDPKNATALSFRAHLLLGEGRYKDALDSANEAVRSDSSLDQAYFAQARANIALHQVDEAKRALHEVLRLHPDFTDALIELARLHMSLRQFETATEFAEQAVKASPLDAEANVTLQQALDGRLDQRQRADDTMRTSSHVFRVRQKYRSPTVTGSSPAATTTQQRVHFDGLLS